MSKKSDTIKPLFDVKHDFYASLDRFAAEVLNLTGALETVLKHDSGIKPNVAEILRERLDAVKAATIRSTP